MHPEVEPTPKKERNSRKRLGCAAAAEGWRYAPSEDTGKRISHIRHSPTIIAASPWRRTPPQTVVFCVCSVLGSPSVVTSGLRRAALQVSVTRLLSLLRELAHMLLEFRRL